MATNLALASIKSTGSSTTRTFGDRFADIINVKDYGATGDGGTDDTTAIQAALNAAFGTAAAPHGQSTNLNSAVFFPAGKYIVSGNPSLLVTGVRGGLIFGEGMASSIIQGNTVAAITFKLNGFGYSCIRDLAVIGGPSGATVALDYDWDNVAPQSSQNSSFINCYFGGLLAAKNSSATAVRIGNSGFQTDTSTFLNCFFSNAQYGIFVNNPNALGHSVIGGNIQQNTNGIYVNSGAIENIQGIQFTVNSVWDVVVPGAAANAYNISSCRSESTNSLSLSSNSAVFHVSGFSHSATSLGTFIQANTAVHIDGCVSTDGAVFMGGGGSTIGNIKISNSVFWRMDAIQVLGSGSSIAATTYLENVSLGPNWWGVGPLIGRQRIQSNVTRTYDVEAANVSTDLGFLYSNYYSPVAQNFFVINGTSTSYGVSPTLPVASPGVVNIGASHFFQGGEPIAFSLVTTGSLPTGISANTTYFVTKDTLTNSFHSQTTFHISDTQAHALAGTNLINFTVAGSGAVNLWSVRKWAVGDTVINTGAVAGGSPGWVCTTAGWAATVNSGETQAVFKAMANIAS